MAAGSMGKVQGAVAWGLSIPVQGVPGVPGPKSSRVASSHQPTKFLHSSCGKVCIGMPGEDTPKTQLGQLDGQQRSFELQLVHPHSILLHGQLRGLASLTVRVLNPESAGRAMWDRALQGRGRTWGRAHKKRASLASCVCGLGKP